MKKKLNKNEELVVDLSVIALALHLPIQRLVSEDYIRVVIHNQAVLEEIANVGLFVSKSYILKVEKVGYRELSLTFDFCDKLESDWWIDYYVNLSLANCNINSILKRTGFAAKLLYGLVYERKKH